MVQVWCINSFFVFRTVEQESEKAKNERVRYNEELTKRQALEKKVHVLLGEIQRINEEKR